MNKRRSLGARTQRSFVLRAPLLAFDELAALSSGLETPGAGDDVEARIERDMERTRAGLRAAYERPEVREALFLASPKLEGGLDAWLDTEGKGSPTRYEQALLRYLTRMSARATPFGLFAGVATGTIDDRTEMILGPTSDHHRSTRPDMQLLTAVAEAMEASPDIAMSLVLRPNSSLYRIGGRLRFAAHSMRGQRRAYRLVALDETEAVAAVLDRARNGARVDELAGLLIDDEVSAEDATAFIVRLVDEQILVGDLAPPLTGDDPVRVMNANLYAASGAESVADTIERCRVELEKFDSEGIGIEPARYRALAGSLEQLPVEIDIARLFQTDLSLATRSSSLGPDVVDAISDGLWAVMSMMSVPRDDALARWRRSFVERYEGREVPLAEALDEELGIGYETSGAPSAEASPLLKGLSFRRPEPEPAALGTSGSFLLRKVHRVVAEGDRALVLSDADIDGLRGDRPVTLPDAFGALAVVARTGDGSPRVLFQGASGPPGAKLLARFCHTDDAVVRVVAEHLRAEENLSPDAVFAEIVHLPEGRTGNVLSRPVLRDHEIEYLGRSGAPRDRVISLGDLFVSVVGDRIVLRSRSLDREVLPRLTSAHNYSLSTLGIYRFLCELQSQHVAEGVVWNWGALDRLPFLPRVEYRRTILSRARWTLDRDEIVEATSPGTTAARMEAVRRLRDDRHIPRWIVLQDEDNELAVDLDNAFALEMLLRLIRDRPFAKLVELWPQLPELVVTGPAGRHMAEVIVPFVRDGEPAASGIRAGGSSARPFVPGSEWLYARIFTGTATADALLRETIAPLVQRAMSEELISRWFFLRYSDPGWHLRVRIKGDRANLTSRVLPALTSAIEQEIGAARAWKLQLDTYEPETERYGGPAAIEIAEELFHSDSDTAVSVLQTAPGDAGMDARWRLALVGIDRLFEDFGLHLETKRNLARRQRDGYALEFRAGKDLKRGIGARFREEKEALAALIGGDPGRDRVMADGLGIIEARSRSSAPAIRKLEGLRDAGVLSVPLDELAATFAHMWVNRVLRSAHRAQEYVIYDLLDRLYAGIAARSR